MSDTALVSLLEVLNDIKEAEDLRAALSTCPILHSA